MPLIVPLQGCARGRGWVHRVCVCVCVCVCPWPVSRLGKKPQRHLACLRPVYLPVCLSLSLLTVRCRFPLLHFFSLTYQRSTSGGKHRQSQRWRRSTLAAKAAAGSSNATELASKQANLSREHKKIYSHFIIFLLRLLLVSTLII